MLQEPKANEPNNLDVEVHKFITYASTSSILII